METPTYHRRQPRDTSKTGCICPPGNNSAEQASSASSLSLLNALYKIRATRLEHAEWWLSGLTILRSYRFVSRSGRYQEVTSRMGDCLPTGKPSRHVTYTKVNSAFHPS